jgi:hypothetical protein
VRDLILPSLAAAIVIYIGLTIAPPLAASCAEPGEVAAGAQRHLAEQAAAPIQTAVTFVIAHTLLSVFWGGQFLIAGLIAKAIHAPLAIGAIACAALILWEVDAIAGYFLYADDGCGNPERFEAPWNALLIPFLALVACASGAAFAAVHAGRILRSSDRDNSPAG